MLRLNLSLTGQLLCCRQIAKKEAIRERALVCVDGQSLPLDKTPKLSYRPHYRRGGEACPNGSSNSPSMPMGVAVTQRAATSLSRFPLSHFAVPRTAPHRNATF